MIFWENDDWFYFKENEVFMELKYISVDYIWYVIFNVKVIICVWNLIDRYGEWDSYFLYNFFFILGSVINLNFLRKRFGLNDVFKFNKRICLIKY